ncbi:MAG TPA: FecR domain-containing protein [Bacteroidales bacterium]|nr:FecR domain-containing protein [Bacteroidales bacterium]
MDNSPKYEIPWELIADSLTGNLTNDGEHLLKQWFLLDPENKKKFLKIQELWKNSTEDYKYYRMANEDEAWKALQVRMGLNQHEIEKPKVIRGDFGHRRKFIRNLLAIASVCIGFIAIIWYFTVRNNPDVFITESTGQKRVSLTDGTVITLHPLTRIEVPQGFGVSRRTVVMVSGEADFEVVHRSDLPFIVELGSTMVRDIGTSFIIRREDNMIHVAVTSGKVAFVRTATKETKELDAGSSISFDEQKKEFTSIKAIESSGAFEKMMMFENTPLSEVIQSMQKVYDIKVEITDDIADKKLTAKLYGMPLDSAIEVICTSLNLEYSFHGNIYMLKAKSSQ